MKALTKFISIFLIVAGVVTVLNACKKDTAATPSISYVRITNPLSSDSLLVSAGQGQLIAIVGENLQDAVQVWFNDQQAKLTPTYVSSNSILVSVPSTIPTTVNNKIKIVFRNGYVLLYDFKVQISKPLLNSMFCEFVNEGDTATILGNYFYNPITVTFTGGAKGQVLASTTPTQLQFIVPANAQPGPITVQTNFGTTVSDFWFRDNRNVIIGSDPYEGWHDPSYVVTNPGPGDPPKINGNYIHVKN